MRNATQLLELKPERLDVGEFSRQPLSVSGLAFVADVSGALYWPAENALIVADLHFEKGSAFAARGLMLPPYDTSATLERLAATLDAYNAETVVCLGDSFHDNGADGRMCAQDRETLAILQEDREWIWITGNHDTVIPECFGGHVLPELNVSGLIFRHEPAQGRVTHEIAGHLHPAARVSFHGHVIRRPCFVGNGNRLVLPAFGTYAGGLNVLDDAFAPVFGSDGVSVLVMGQEGLYPIASRLLKED
ncbi:metallophosphatase [Hyphomicrobium nitrativorans NL23]|uniref:Metallophosphatase n=1 Tax=Hyphomicrobium nitrativorans NL23 TaxID=1029756 RepID=V5SB54_9HYPH|nr:ligase-associated DNA damage response endonuclease PdeM [Hyphomicrobium nitrativorans]AHB47164.1 metallophosphatase [Hyphomicrobium nitrativorans NL23]